MTLNSFVFFIFYFKIEGFRYSAADFYNRGLSVKYYSIRKGPYKCHFKKPTYLLWLQQIELFIKQMNTMKNKDVPYFSYTFISEYTHDYLSVPRDFDYALTKMLQNFKDKGWLENTLVILFGDHGHRMSSFSRTPMGRFERNRPFFSMKLPNKFRKSIFLKNLQSNKNKLSTFIDVYQTLRQILYINKFNQDVSDQENSACRNQFKKNDHKIRTHRGISLLEQIPENRTCHDAMISMKRCSCLQRNITENMLLTHTGHSFKNVMDIMVKYINTIFDVDRKICETYEPKKFISITNSGENYRCSIIASPGDVYFEANLVFIENKMLLIDHPSRLSVYGNQSYCIKDSILRNYCYCKKIQS